MKINVTPPANSMNNVIRVKRLKRPFKVFLFSLLGIIYFQSTAQTNFQTDLIRNSRYYDSLIAIRGADSMQGTGYVQYQRWLRYWAPRLLPNLDYIDYHQNILNYAQSYSPSSSITQNTNIQWKLIGPNNMPNGGVYNGRGTGQIHYIYKDPYDLTGNTVFACSPVGGLFRSTNGGEVWNNAGTDKGLPRCGVSSVVVDSHNADTWYVTTGNGESYIGDFIWQLSIGVYRTINAGESWDPIALDSVQNMRKIIEINSVNENTSLLLTTTSGLFRIDNANTQSPTVTLIKSGQFYDVEQDLNNDSIIYASGSDTIGVYKIDLSNNSAIEILNPDTLFSGILAFPHTRRISIEISPAEPDYVYAIYSLKDNNGSYLCIFDIQNNKWIKKGVLPSDFNGYARTLGWTIRKNLHAGRLPVFGRDAYSLHVYYDSLNNNNTDTAECLKYNNIGETPHDDFHYLMIEENNMVVWAGTDGGVYRGEFINENTIYWYVKNKGLGVATVEYMDPYKSSSNGFSIVTSGQFDCGSNIYETDDEINWTASHKLGGDGYQTIILNDLNYYLSYHEGVIWNSLHSEGNNINGGNFIGNCSPNDTIIKTYANFETYFDHKSGYLYMTGQKEIRRYDTTNPSSGWVDWSSFSNDTYYPEMGCGRSGTWQIAITHDNIMYVSTYGKVDDWYFQIYKSNGGGTGNGVWKLIKNKPIHNDSWINAIKPIENSTNEIYVSIRDSIFRVDATKPDSAVWTNITYDLSVISINCIDLENNTRVWIGTDQGVYYFDNETNLWVNYTSDLPNAEVTSIKIRQNQVYVGTYGRGVWFASAPGCGSAATKTIKPGESVCDQCTKTFYGDIIIPSGVTYSVYGTLKMGAGCRIIVERGAKLLVDGGIITNACPDMWMGIELQGNSNAPQDTINQGWVVVKHYATIENSEQAIITIKNNGSVSDLNYAGGVIQADDSFFRNNTNSIIMFPYPHAYSLFAIKDNISYFNNCTFEWDDNYYFFNEQTATHVQMDGVSGVKFTKNIFTNIASSNFATGDKRGNGLVSFNSGFKVVSSAFSLTHNTFSNLNYGIHSIAYFQHFNYQEISNAVFNNNLTGCYLSAETYATVTNNLFNASEIEGNYSEGHRTGLYLDNCTDYQIEDNEFYSDYQSASRADYQSVGLYVNNSGPYANMVYNNDFHNLQFATIVQGINRNEKMNTGLQIKCNDYAENSYDISVLYTQPNTNNGIAAQQGAPGNNDTLPAGNTFTFNNDPNSYFNYLNNGGNFDYYLPNYALSQVKHLIPENRSPEPKIKLHFAFLLNHWTHESGCPSHLASHTIAGLKSLVSSSQMASDAYIDSLNTFVDGGNTTGLALDVATSIPPETMQLRSELLDASPYLSDTVMVSAVEKEDVLPNSILTEVLASNPQSAKSNKVLNKLDNRQTPPSQSQMALIHANDTVLGHKEKMESALAHYTALQYQANDQLVRVYMEDSLQQGLADSIEQALNYIQSPEIFYQRAFYRYLKNDSLGTVELLNEIPLEFELDEDDDYRHDDYEAFFELLLDIKTRNKNLAEIDSTQLDELYNIIQNQDHVLGSYCRNILISYGGLEYHEPYLFPQPLESKSSNFAANPLLSSNEGEHYFKIYPNPAGEYLTIEYSLDLPKTNGVFEIFSINGIQKSIVESQSFQGIQTIDLRGWESGVYLIKISVNGKVLQTEKFTKH